MFFGPHNNQNPTDEYLEYLWGSDGQELNELKALKESLLSLESGDVIAIRTLIDELKSDLKKVFFERLNIAIGIVEEALQRDNFTLFATLLEYPEISSKLYERDNSLLTQAANLSHKDRRYIRFVDKLLDFDMVRNLYSDCMSKEQIIEDLARKHEWPLRPVKSAAKR